MLNAGQVEQLCTLINFRPESILQELLSLLQCFSVGNRIEMCKNSHDFRHAVNLTDVEEFKDFHLEAKTGVTHEQNEIGTLGNVNHSVDVVVAFNDRKTAFL